MSEHKAVVKNADMDEELQQEAVDIACEAISKHSMEKDIAAYIKKAFDKAHSGPWHCIVGKTYGR